MFNITYLSSAGVSSVASASVPGKTLPVWVSELLSDGRYITEITLDGDETHFIDKQLREKFNFPFADLHDKLCNVDGFIVLRGYSVGLFIRMVVLLESWAASIERARDFQDGGNLQADLGQRQTQHNSGTLNEVLGWVDAIEKEFSNDVEAQKLQSEAVPGRQWVNPNKYPFYVPFKGQAVEWVELDGSAGAGNFDGKFTNHFIKFSIEEGKPGQSVRRESILKWRAL